LLHRLRNRALREGVPTLRLQQRVAFERLLARLGTNGDWVLKGGFALQLRYGLQARPTKDVDLRTALAPHQVKDLVDLAFLAYAETVSAESLRASVEATFTRRATHPTPRSLPEPPPSWAPSFAAIAATVNLPTGNLSEGYRVAARFWDPVLTDVITDNLWIPGEGRWG
jgi:hypothetical protein